MTILWPPFVGWMFFCSLLFRILSRTRVNNKFSDLSVHPDFYIVPSHIVVERRKEFNGGPIDIFKKDIIEYQNKWEILGTFVENGELSTEKK